MVTFGRCHALPRTGFLLLPFQSPPPFNYSYEIECIAFTPQTPQEMNFRARRVHSSGIATDLLQTGNVLVLKTRLSALRPVYSASYVSSSMSSHHPTKRHSYPSKFLTISPKAGLGIQCLRETSSDACPMDTA